MGLPGHLPWGSGRIAARRWALAAADAASELGLELGASDWYTYNTESRVLVGPAPDPTTIPILSDAGFLACSLRLVSTNALAVLTVELQDEHSGVVWQNAPVPALSVTGDGRFPYELPVPAYLPALSGLRVVVAETAGQTTTWQLEVEGIKLSSGLRALADVISQRREHPFFYTATLALAAGAGVSTTLSPPLQIHDDSDFECYDLQSTIRTNWDVQFQQMGKAYTWQNRGMRAENVFGDGQRPGTLALPLRLDSKDSINITGTNRQAGAHTPIITLAGAKVYR